jgi:hypothetical protein
LLDADVVVFADLSKKIPQPLCGRKLPMNEAPENAHNPKRKKARP